MSATLEDLNHFHGFAIARIEAGGHDWTLQELLDEWELQNVDSTRQEADRLAVRAAMRDLKTGERGLPFDEHIEALATEFGLDVES